ncbi:MAG: hypothetical protein V5B34_16300 [Accumulibacter sp.]
MLGSAAGTLSINKLQIDLKSQGIAVGKDTLHSYLSHLDGHEELIHVCASVDHPETFVREIRALQDAASEFLRDSRAQITPGPTSRAGSPCRHDPRCSPRLATG